VQSAAYFVPVDYKLHSHVFTG